VSGISSQEAVGEEEDQKEGRLGAGQDAKTRDQNLYVFSWLASRLAFVDCPVLSVPKLPVSS
jgi:hypothetical protein